MIELTRTVSRDRQPLSHRRVRHIESGRVGTIESAHPSLVGNAGEARVYFDDGERTWGTYIKRERVPLAELELLDAPPITAPVFIRRVLFRGHKEQVAERIAALGPLPEDATAAGARRYVEFDPQPAAYRRWRIVYVGPPVDPEQVAATPDVASGAQRLRKSMRDVAHDYDDGYGY